MFAPPLLPRAVNEDAAHGLGGCGKKVSPAVPIRWYASFAIHQPEIGLVNQSRGLERLSWFFLSQLLGGKLPQFVVDQRQQLFGGVRIASLDCGKDARDIAHY